MAASDDIQGGFAVARYPKEVRDMLKGILPTPPGKCVKCKECSYMHPVDADHYDWQCRICFKLHYPCDCPYLRRIPPNAPYNEAKYQVMCGACGHHFNEGKWTCTYCDGNWALLRDNSCFNCCSWDHPTWECPKDKALSAAIKESREKLRNSVPHRTLKGVKPYTPVGPRYDHLFEPYTPVSPRYSNVT